MINDIAAQALSLQPKGYTLETTEVCAIIPVFTLFTWKMKVHHFQLSIFVAL